ncbi:hypothetical protein ACW7BJ_27760 [Azospirillum argentinense]
MADEMSKPRHPSVGKEQWSALLNLDGHRMQPAISIPMATADGGEVRLVRVETWVAGRDGKLRHYVQAGRPCGDQIWPVVTEEDFQDALREEVHNRGPVFSSLGLGPANEDVLLRRRCLDAVMSSGWGASPAGKRWEFSDYAAAADELLAAVTADLDLMDEVEGVLRFRPLNSWSEALEFSRKRLAYVRGSVTPVGETEVA